MGFLDTLSDLNRQNFGGGLASYGKAIADLADNQYLVKGVNEFKEKKRLFENEQLKTTTEQLSEANSNIDTNGDNSLIRQAVKNSLHLIEYYDKVGAYQKLYQPFITSFATLGEDGVRVAATLSQELGDKVSNLERKSLAPMKELEYEQMKLDWSGKDLQLRIASSNEKTKRDISKVAQYMMDNDLMTAIPGGKVTSYIRSDWVKYNSSRKAIIDDAKSHFQGMELSDNVLGPAFELAQQYLGNEFHFINKPEEIQQNNNYLLQYEAIGLPQDKSYLISMTQKRGVMSPNEKELLRKYMIEPMETSNSNSFKDLDSETRKNIIELSNVFGPNGLYQQASLRVSDYYRRKGINWNNIRSKKINIGDDKNPEIYDIQSVDMDENIARFWGPYGAVNENEIYDPFVHRKYGSIAQKLKLKIDDLNAKNNFSGTPDDIFTKLSKIPSNTSLTYPGFMQGIQPGYMQNVQKYNLTDQDKSLNNKEIERLKNIQEQIK